MRQTIRASAVFLFFLCFAVSAWAGTLDPRLAALTSGGRGFLHATARGYALARRTGAVDPMLPRVRGDGRVQVYIHPVTPGGPLVTARELATVGAVDLRTSRLLGVVQAWVPVSGLKALAGLPGVGRVSVPSYVWSPGPGKNPLTVLSHAYPAQAATLPVGLPIDHAAIVAMQADKLQALGATGAGVKIGLISTGVAGLSDSQAAGYLPNDVWVDPGMQGSASKSEGTAMLEEAHAMMPDATLGFCSPASTVDFLTCYTDLAAWGANMIADDLGYFEIDYFTAGTQIDGSFARAVSLFTTAHPKMAFMSSAGNDAQDIFQARYIPGAGETIDGTSYPSLMDFGLAAGGSSTTRLPVAIGAGRSIFPILEWNDPVYTSPDVLVLYLLTSGGTVLAKSSFHQAQDGRIAAAFAYTAGSANEHDYLVVACQSCANPITIKLDAHGDGGARFGYTTSGSVGAGQKVADNVLALAATGLVSERPLSINREVYSGMGPFLYGDFGSTATLDKPDMTGMDAVLVSGAGGFGRPMSTGGALFCGTSATGANVGALIAALMQAKPDQDANFYYSTLQTTANQSVFVASPTTGPCLPSTMGYSPAVAGAGLAQGYAALASIYNFPRVSITAPTAVANGESGTATVPVGVAITYQASVQGGTNTASASGCHWTENGRMKQTGESAVYTATAAGGYAVEVNCPDNRGIGSPTPPKLTVNAERIPAPTVTISHANRDGFDLSLTGNEPLTVTLSSNNTAVLPDSGISVAPSGCGVSTLQCTVSLRPMVFAHGTATVTVTAQDAWAREATDTAKLNYGSGSGGAGAFGGLALAVLAFLAGFLLLSPKVRSRSGRQ